MEKGNVSLYPLKFKAIKFYYNNLSKKTATRSSISYRIILLFIWLLLSFDSS